MNQNKRIAITGPESTGKSQLAAELASKFNTIWVPEYARIYLNEINRQYNYKDILIIAKKQIEYENNQISKANGVLICDTDLTVTKIWCEFKYKKCHKWIKEQFLNHKYDLYLLCNNDLPWQADIQRENQNERDELFLLYQKTLIDAEFPTLIIKGKGIERTQQAIKAIENLLL